MRRRFLKQLQNGLPAGKDRLAAARVSWVLLCTGFLSVVVYLGASHPVSPNMLVNLGYHVGAFFATLIVWAVLAFGGGAVLFKMVKEPPPWAVLGLLAVTLFAATYGRFQVDKQLRLAPLYAQH